MFFSQCWIMEKVLHLVIQNNMNIQRLLRIITSSLHAGLVLRYAVFQMFVNFDVGNFSLCSWDPVAGQSASPSVLLLLSQFLSFMKWGWLLLWEHCFSHLMYSLLWTRPSWLLKAKQSTDWRVWTDLIGWGQEAIVFVTNFLMNLQIPWNPLNFLTT